MARATVILFVLALAALITGSRWIFVPWWVYAVVTLLFIGALVYGSSVPSAGFFLPVQWRGSRTSQAVAITFDDGPVPGHTERILNILEMHGVPAAFFCIGNRVEANQHLVRRMHEAGHLIGNHSYWHRPTFDLQRANRIHAELKATDKIIELTIGLRPLYFRPPYGVTNPMVATAVRRGGYATIGWSIRSFDTVIDDRMRLFNRITRSLRAGDIILLHDQGPCTADVLPDVLRHIVSLGLKIVRVDQLVNKKAYA